LSHDWLGLASEAFPARAFPAGGAQVCQSSERSKSRSHRVGRFGDAENVTVGPGCGVSARIHYLGTHRAQVRLAARGRDDRDERDAQFRFCCVHRHQPGTFG
jgi:hypothetical protein